MPLKKLLFFFFFIVSFLTSSQTEYSGEVNLTGLVSSGEKLPFWMHQNQRGRILENTNVAGWISGKAIFETGFYSTLEIGMGGLVRDNEDDEFAVDEAYAHFETESLFITAGIKHEEELYNGLSASNRSVLWSLNSRALPGIQIGTNEPVFFNRENYGFGFEGSWEEYYLADDRFVDNAKLHNKNLFLVYRTKDDLEIKGGLRHMAQWGGTSEKDGQRPQSVQDYLKLITSLGHQDNILANDIGSYELYITRDFDDFSIGFLYNYLFETFPGSRLANIPDGRYGVFLEFNEDRGLINSFMYEFYYTKNQSQFNSDKNIPENYFTGTAYRSGHTYHRQVIGTSFFTAAPGGMGVSNNRFAMHHLGIGGDFTNRYTSYPFRLLLSFGKNYGTYANPYKIPQEVLYWSYEMLLLNNFVELNLQLAAEINSTASPVFGVGVQLKKQF